MNPHRNERSRALFINVAIAVAVLALPLIFRHDFVRSMLSSMGIAVIFALSYNMLFGQTGVLSFGHAIYSGLGAYCAIHFLGAINAGLPFPVTLLPLIGGLSGMAFGLLFGYLSSKRAGTTFAMITLGIGELVSACAFMLPGLFGGEVGVSANRAAASVAWDFHYGSSLSVYYLIAGWMLLSILAMAAFSRTPLGKIANALRDNAERLRFVGYNPHAVRFRVQLVSSFFAGIAGALSAINYEIVTIDGMGVAASGTVMLMTVIGGAGSFFGPILGAVLVTFLQTGVSVYTNAWLFYFGLLFLVVMYCAPDGLSSLVTLHRPVWRARRLPHLLPSYGLALLSGLIMTTGIVLAVEVIYRLSDKSAGNMLVLFGMRFDPVVASTWLIPLCAMVVGAVLLKLSVVRVQAAWKTVMERHESVADEPMHP
jgi:branched-chain amino acid transport system permease protein